MIHRLPQWVWLGGFLLAAIAGMVNAVALLSLHHQGVTHLTGNLTSLGSDLAHADFRHAAHLITLIAAFFGGCVLSGILIRDTHLKLGRRYGVALLTESLLIFAAVPALQHHLALGLYLLAAAAGLQNAMVTTYSSAIVRTTHVTGLITDLGITLGHALAGQPCEPKKATLLLALTLGFLVGAVAATAQYQMHHAATLYTPAALLALAGGTYTANRLRHRKP